MTAAHFPRVDLLPCQRKDLVMRFATAQMGYFRTRRQSAVKYCVGISPGLSQAPYY